MNNILLILYLACIILYYNVNTILSVYCTNKTISIVSFNILAILKLLCIFQNARFCIFCLSNKISNFYKGSTPKKILVYGNNSKRRPQRTRKHYSQHGWNNEWLLSFN